MLLSIDNARKILPNIWLVFTSGTAMASAMFLFPLFKGDIPTDHLLAATGGAACVGLIMGLYLKFRSNYGTAAPLFFLSYLLLILEFMFAGGSAATVLWIGGRSDLRWLAVYTNAFCMAISLLGGVYREAKALAWWGADAPDRWKKKMEKYVDYSKHQVIAMPMTTPSTSEDKLTQYVPFIIAVGSANIPLLFELFGGGRYNAIFIAAPILTGTFAYINFKNFGPALARLLLLRKLEKSLGRRFVNADLEQIQELRRTFFLSRWLMKDYASPRPVQQPVQPPLQKPVKPQKKRK